MSELAEAVRAAQKQAELHFGDGPVAPWEPPTPLGTLARRRLAWVAGTALLVMFGLVAVAVATARRGEPAAVAEAATLWPERPADDPDDVGETTVAETAVSESGSLATWRLGRIGVVWHLDARGVSRLEAAKRLAEASGSTLHGSLEALAAARPLHLHWQGRSLAEAWARMLGPDLNYALQCRASRCQAWILGLAGAAAPRAEPVASPIPPDAPLLPMPGTADDEAHRD